jgi:hypothetical protein
MSRFSAVRILVNIANPCLAFYCLARVCFLNRLCTGVANSGWRVSVKRFSKSFHVWRTTCALRSNVNEQPCQNHPFNCLGLPYELIRRWPLGEKCFADANLGDLFPARKILWQVLWVCQLGSTGHGNCEYMPMTRCIDQVTEKK